MVRQVDNETLTAEELAAFDEDIEQLIDSAQTKTSVTYHYTGTYSTNRYTGVRTESSGDSDTVNAIRLKPDQREMEDLRIEQASDVWLILASDLANAPQVNDYITVSSQDKYVVYHANPMPGKHYKIWTRDKGN